MQVNGAGGTSGGIGQFNMTAFDLIVILVLLVGGTGLFLRSLTDAEKSPG